jgi:hypothetical protein
MNAHAHSVAVRGVSDLYIIEVAAKSSILCCLDDNAIWISSVDRNRACVAGEDERC